MKHFTAENLNVVWPDSDDTGVTKLSWQCGLEVRKWGVKGIYAIVPEQTIVITVTTPDGDSTDRELRLTDCVAIMPFDSIPLTPDYLELGENGEATLIFE